MTVVDEFSRQFNEHIPFYQVTLIGLKWDAQFLEIAIKGKLGEETKGRTKWYFSLLGSVYNTVFDSG